MKLDIRMIYLYVVALSALLITTFGTIRLVNNFLTTTVFPEANRYYYATPVFPEKDDSASPEEMQRREEEARKAQEQAEKSQKQQERAGSFAQILVGLPLYIYHWHIIQKERKKK